MGALEFTAEKYEEFIGRGGAGQCRFQSGLDVIAAFVREEILSFAGPCAANDPVPELLISETGGTVRLFTNHLLRLRRENGGMLELVPDDGFLETAAETIANELTSGEQTECALPDEEPGKYAGKIAEYIAAREKNNLNVTGGIARSGGPEATTVFRTPERNIMLRLLHFICVCLPGSQNAQNSRTGTALKKLSGPVLKLAVSKACGGYSYAEMLALKAAASCLVRFG
ncbi:MAG: hypothetical protein J5950_06120 [Clostridia bacterium]|nr:hypothetical protein [Clostridia bacterium]